jgi:hypothetical protein
MVPVNIFVEKNDPFPTYEPPKVSVFFVTSDWTSD